MAKEEKIELIPGNYETEDDQVVDIVRIVPQPDKIEKETYTVKDVKREIKDLTSEIAEKTERLNFLNKILTKSSKK